MKEFAIVQLVDAFQIVFVLTVYFRKEIIRTDVNAYVLKTSQIFIRLSRCWSVKLMGLMNYRQTALKLTTLNLYAYILQYCYSPSPGRARFLSWVRCLPWSSGSVRWVWWSSGSVRWVSWSSGSERRLYRDWLVLMARSPPPTHNAKLIVKQAEGDSPVINQEYQNTGQLWRIRQ